jgi:enoyl-CoA hydratase/carnithine racemase
LPGVESSDVTALALTTVSVSVAAGVATVVLDRPEVHNSFDPVMVSELASVWQAIRLDANVRAVVVTGRGEKAFCTGIDRSSIDEFAFDPFTYEDPGVLLGPKSQGLWKPVVAAVNGMACGGAFYILGEADVLLAAPHATFFDPHVTYGMTAAFEPILLLRRMPFGDVLRLALAGNHERLSATTAQRLGLVSEVVDDEDVVSAAERLAGIFAAQPPHAIQATLRTLWAARDMPISQASQLGNVFLQLGTSIEALNEGEAAFQSGARITPTIR